MQEEIIAYYMDAFCQKVLMGILCFGTSDSHYVLLPLDSTPPVIPPPLPHA